MADKKLEDAYRAGWNISFNTKDKIWVGEHRDKLVKVVGEHQSAVFKEICKVEHWDFPEEKPPADN